MRKQQKEIPVNLVGKILRCQWGYGMILNTYVRVIKQTAKRIVAEELKNEYVSADGFLTGLEQPTDKAIVPQAHEPKNANHYNLIYIGEESNGDHTFKSKKGGFNQYFRVWDGQPNRYDHCD